MSLTKKVLFILYLLVVGLAVFFIIWTDFNPVGYDYHLGEDESRLTIEEGFVQKERYELEVTTTEAIQVMLPINEANHLWGLNLAIFSLIVATWGIIYRKYIRKRKHAKWFVLGFLLFLAIFTIGHFNEHLQLHETITEEVNAIRE